MLSPDGESHDGMEWLLGYTLQLYSLKAGVSLEERINLFARCLGFTRSKIIIKRGPAFYDKASDKWSGHKDVITIQQLIEYLDGKPCPEGGCTDDGLRTQYHPEMDCPERCEFHYKQRKKIEQQLDYYFFDMVEVIDRNYLCSREVMNAVSQQIYNKARERV